MKIPYHASSIPIYLLAVFTFSSSARAVGNWSQYRGSNHDGVSPEKISLNWPANGLKPLWKVPMTDGFSAITLGEGNAYTLMTREVEGAAQEVCVALDAATGKEKWAAPIGIAKYDGGGERGAPGNDGGDGPRSTPCFDESRVYVYSTRMVLKCFDSKTGKVLWSHDIIKEHAGQNIHWGSAASPVIEGDLVYVAGGGAGESLLAFNKKSGELAWKFGDERLTHSTPVVATILGERQVIFFTQSGLVSLKAANGAELWRYAFKYKGSAGMSPVVAGDVVYCSIAYGMGAGACKVTKEGENFTAKELWFQPANVLSSHWSTPVCANGYLYGLFGQAKFGTAPLQCVELATGNILWSKPDFGPGGCVLVDGKVLVLSDTGDLVLVEASPKAYKEMARSHILNGKCWNGVGLENGLVFARSTKEGVCVSIAP